MKIAYCSDLHVDFNKDPDLRLPKDDEYDVMLVCGDVANHPKESVRYINKLQSQLNKELIFVPGNHDRWSKGVLTFSETENILKTTQCFQNRTVKVIGEQRFLCCTLWYKLIISNGREWSDLNHINDWKTVQTEHDLDQKFLQENMQKGDIVVTHMLPSFETISYKYIGSPDNRFYMTEMKQLIEERKPLAWFHGHSHEFLFRKIEDTFFLRNPRGYYSHFEMNNETRLFNGICIFDTEDGSVLSLG